MLMPHYLNSQLLERVKMQLASFLEDPQYHDQHSLHMEIIKTFGRVGPNAEPKFRDECMYLYFSIRFFSNLPSFKQTLSTVPSCILVFFPLQ